MHEWGCGVRDLAGWGMSTHYDTFCWLINDRRSITGQSFSHSDQPLSQVSRPVGQVCQSVSRLASQSCMSGQSVSLSVCQSVVCQSVRSICSVRSVGSGSRSLSQSGLRQSVNSVSLYACPSASDSLASQLALPEAPAVLRRQTVTGVHWPYTMA